MKRPEPTQKHTREAARRRGDRAGFLGMAELAMLTAPPAGACDTCQRKTWEHALLDHWCAMTQPDGSKCAGTFRAGARADVSMTKTDRKP